MTLIHRFTPGINGTETNGPFDTNRTGIDSIAVATTRSEVFDRIRDALIGAGGAGWTNSFIQAPGTDETFTSIGEDGTSNIAFRMILRSNRYLYLVVSPKVDVSGQVEKPLLDLADSGPPGTVDLSTSGNYEMQIFASRDFCWVFLRRSTTYQTIFVGNLTPVAGNPTKVFTSGAAAAGEFVTVNCASDPRVAGYRVNELVQIVNLANSGSAVAEHAHIVGLSATTVTFRRLRFSYDTGAVFGFYPCPIAQLMTSNNDTNFMSNVGHWRTPFIHGLANMPDGDYVIDNLTTGGGQGIIPSANPYFQDIYGLDMAVGLPLHEGSTLERGYGSQTDPSRRSEKFICRSMQLVVAGSTKNRTTLSGLSPEGNRPTALGVLPAVFAYPGSVILTPNPDIAERNRANTTVEDYFFWRLTGSSSEYYICGPVPT